MRKLIVVKYTLLYSLMLYSNVITALMPANYTLVLPKGFVFYLVLNI